ncbi:MAG: zinc ribbon domain-containing protein [Ignavibacteria bacterium]|nr:zinc ribbon domain-containing protein [Ignavibacteria bacterium]
MPFYEYQCSNCGHELEELQKMSDPPLKKCPACGKNTLKKLIGTGAGLIFKGSGFYLTDYKNKQQSGSRSGKAKETQTTDTSKAENKTEDSASKVSKSAEKKSPSKKENNK